MTLLATVLAAIITSIIWYKKDNRKEYCLNVLLYMFWGASIMWLVDAIVELIQEGAAYFMPEEGTTIEETLMNQMHFFSLSLSYFSLIFSFYFSFFEMFHSNLHYHYMMHF